MGITNQLPNNFEGNAFQQLGDTLSVKPVHQIDSLVHNSIGSIHATDSLKQAVKPVIIRPRVVKVQVQVQVDTVCHICPKSEPVGILQPLSDSSFNNAFLPEVTLYDKSEFAKFQKVTTPVFIETKSSKINNKTNFPAEKEIVNTSYFSEWIFIPIFILLLVVAIVKNAYSKFIVLLFQGASHLYYAEKIFQEKSLFGQRANMFLDLLYLFSLPLIVLFSVNYFDKDIFNSFNPLLGLLFIFLAFFILRIFRYISIKSLGYISNQWEAVNLLYFNQLLYLRIIGLINIPILFFLVYTNGSTHNIILFFALSVIGISLLFRTLRMFQVFIKKGFSIFYFLLYLCALEIIPLLVLIKEINRW